MYDSSLALDDIIRAFQNHVPGTYVRDYRSNKGFITLCRQYRSIPWGRGGETTTPVYEQVPAITLGNYPYGRVYPRTQYIGVRLHRPGWREQFRKAMSNLTLDQMRAITDELNVGEVFPGVV